MTRVRSAAAFSPLAVLLAHGMPWWAYLLACLSGPAAYIYRLHGVFRLAAKALDKADRAHVTGVMTTVTGCPAAFQGLPAQRRPGSSTRTRTSRDGEATNMP